jgi:chemotaxis protein CheC
MAPEKDKGNMSAEIKLSPLQLDALKEVSAIGMGNAAITFAELIGDKVGVKLSAFELAPVAQVADILGKKNTLVTAVFLRMRGDLTGVSLLLLPRESAITLADILNGREASPSVSLTEIDRSALGELGSMLTASYLKAVTDMLDLNVKISVPSVVFNTVGDIVRFVLAGSQDNISYSLIAQTEFSSTEKYIKGEFLFLLNEATILKLLSSVYDKLKRSKDEPV